MLTQAWNYLLMRREICLFPPFYVFPYCIKKGNATPLMLAVPPESTTDKTIWVAKLKWIILYIRRQPYPCTPCEIPILINSPLVSAKSNLFTLLVFLFRGILIKTHTPLRVGPTPYLTARKWGRNHQHWHKGWATCDVTWPCFGLSSFPLAVRSRI